MTDEPSNKKESRVEKVIPDAEKEAEISDRQINLGD